MKKLKKQLFAAVLTAVMAVSAFAGTTPVSAASLSAKQYLTKMAKATEKVKSYEMKMNMNMDMSAEGQTSSIKTTSTAIAFTKPMKLKTVITMTMPSADGKTAKMKMTSYTVQKNNKLLQYTSMDGKKYAKSTLDMTDYSSTLDSLQATDMYSDMKIVKKNVKVNGTSTVQVDAQISGGDMMNVIEQLGVTGTDSQETVSDYSSFSPIKVSIWIDKKTYYPIKQTVDMKDFMNEYLATIQPDTQISYSKINTSVTYKNFNKAAKFSLPKSCK